MERKSDIRAEIDNARLMTKLSVIGGILTAVLLLIPVLIFGVIKPDLIGSDVFALGVVPYSLAVVFAFASMIYGMLATSAAQEAEEKQLLEKRSDTHALNVEEDVRFTAGRSFENYKKYAPYVLSILGAVLVAVLLVSFSRYWNGRLEKPAVAGTVYGPVASAVFAALSLFMGAFFVGQSRQPAFRWLRAFGAWLLAGFGIMFVSMLVTVFASNGGKLDSVAAQVIFVMLAVLGGEFIVSFIIEFYRPRTMREMRPIFESKLLALFTEPGGVMRNIALALDYQFGFKVSGTWLYSFMERSFFPVVLFWALIFWAFTMIHEVGPSQVGIKERLGKVVSEELLQPGIYWTLPYPFGQVKRFSCTEIHQVVIGESHDEGEAEEDDYVDDGHGHARPEKKNTGHEPTPVVLWTAAHGSDANNFIVAVDPRSRGGKAEAASGSEAEKNEDRNAASIAFIRMMIPIDYRIRPDGVMDYAYRNADPVATLTRIGQQAATEYLASTSVMDIMSSGRAAAQVALQERIQKLADEHHIGIDIVKVMILDSHPPVEKVAPAFQDVIGAMEEKEATVLKAKSYAARTVPEAQASAARILSAANSYSFRTTTISEAEAGRFKTQLATYQLMPRMFRLKSYLDFLENDCRDVRKFIVAAGLDNEVYQLNFETKQQLDLIDVDASALGGN